MALPIVKTFEVTREKISLFWKASPLTDVIKWNVYGSPTVPIDMNDPIKGVDLQSFTLIKEGVANRETPMTPGSVWVSFTREELGIEADDTYYFYITSINNANEESEAEVSNLHAVPYGDDHYVDEAGQPVNLQYKSFEFEMPQTSDWDRERCLDIISLLGRASNMIRLIVTEGSVQVTFNAYNNDIITLSQDDALPFQIQRGELYLKKIWFHSPDGTAKVKIFISG